MEATVNTPNKYPSRAQKHLEVYEPWHADHELAMACRDLEEWLNEGVRVFEMIRYEDRVYRVGVFGGLIPATEAPGLESLFHQRYERWLAVARSGAEAVRMAGERFGQVDHANEYKRGLEFAEVVVRGRKPAALALAAGSRFDELTEAEAEELRAIMAALPSSPGKLTRPTKKVPDGDPSLLR